jgi:hypothetical protein
LNESNEGDSNEGDLIISTFVNKSQNLDFKIESQLLNPFEGAIFLLIDNFTMVII